MTTLEDRGRSEGSGVQDPAAHGGQQREDALERRALAAGEDRDVAGVRTMAAAGDRTVDRLAAERAHLLPEPAGPRPRRWSTSPSRSVPRPSPRAGPSPASSTAPDAAGVGRQVMTASAASIIRAGLSPPARAPRPGAAARPHDQGLAPSGRIRCAAANRRACRRLLPSPMKPILMRLAPPFRLSRAKTNVNKLSVPRTSLLPPGTVSGWVRARVVFPDYRGPVGVHGPGCSEPQPGARRSCGGAACSRSCPRRAARVGSVIRSSN